MLPGSNHCFESPCSWSPALLFSDTTRAPRPGEQDGISYHFVDRLQFEDLVAKGAFLEHAQFGGNLYGTTAKAVQDVSTQTGKRAILDIDAQGVKLLKANHSYLAPLYLFISPPTLSALHSRLKSRGTETPSSIYHRLSMAAGEMSYAREAGQFEVVIVNDDLQRAYELFRSAVRSEDSASVRGDVVPPEEKEGDVLGTAKKEMEQEAKQ